MKKLLWVLAVASVAHPGLSRAELVLENAPVTPAPVTPSNPVAPSVVIVQQPVAPQQQAQPVVVAPSVAPSADESDSVTIEETKVSRSERLRRQRMREELKNEDLLQTRLEELRLKSESARTDQIDTFGSPAPVATPAVTVVAPAPEVERISPMPVLESPAPVPALVGASVLETKASSKRSVYLNPSAGLVKLIDTAGYDAMPRFAAGVALGVQANDHVAIEASYTYAQHSIFVVSSNPFVRSASFGGNPFVGVAGNGSVDMSLKQNLFEIGPKFFLLNRESALRPFLGFAGVYGYSFLNYNPNTVAALRNNGWGFQNGLGQDYVLSQFAGSVQAGLELDITESLSFGATFRYYRMLTSYENYPINNAALYWGSQVPVYDPSLWDKSTVGGSLSSANAYSIQANLRFTF